ncbi:Asp-tRNA(Asn)/Glu-tRNA(Gln) amidotransferase subunit GatA [Candidatus Cytomitobacter indipagum]|uniref:Glutamyl-tRNA(Gln) amidotransferase subunit A n=1 Tax=Candidatus Cytomitobacter indipagum TaxID=2601575 RepID=A0A5C0UF75_9PROT|nr:Asp-tRNA(Asn)/Glu-tRNA(Gln) amidotransferase subunit GatA [Candidatus Cytomitobacter indipagum]QEK37912.1 Asp-tRNA(Asn)/Glu-tRNA(Gln) amidotransferase subunit GatA [Candidatus Cytomitobacter indipagum]
MKNNCSSLSLKQIRDLLKVGQISPLTLVSEMYDEIDKFSNLNNFIALSKDMAFEQAEKSWKRIKDGNARKLEGIPIGVKDLYAVKNLKMTACSKALENFVAPFESQVTENLWNEGAICLGKLNMDEFAMGSSNRTSCFGASINPWSNGDKLVPGGSSGGSASAVASGTCFAALGSDTGGSVRQPASFCGIVGFKPSYGRCSRRGMIAYASSFDQAGIFARSVEDAAIMMDSMMSHDSGDSMSSMEKIPNLENANISVKGKVIGYPANWMDDLDSHVVNNWKKALKILEDLGAIIKPIDLLEFDAYLSTYYLLTSSEAASNLARYTGVCYGNKTDKKINPEYNKTFALFGEEVRRRIFMGVHNLSQENYENGYSLGLKTRKYIKNQFMDLFNDVSMIVYPCSPREAFGVDSVFQNPSDAYHEDVFTVIANLIGSPAISVPIGLGKNNLPLGIHLMTKSFEEEFLISAAKEIEKYAEFKGWLDYDKK